MNEGKTYRDGLIDACKIIEFYLRIGGKPVVEGNVLLQPYLDIGHTIHMLDGNDGEFEWSGESLSKRFGPTADCDTTEGTLKALNTILDCEQQSIEKGP